MKGRSAATAATVCLLLLAGCASLGASDVVNDTPTPEPTDAQPTDRPTDTPTDEPVIGSSTNASEEWSSPDRPNLPLEIKLNESQRDRIDSVTVVSGANESGVTLRVAVNTSMPSVDPAEYGTVRGEPYLIAYTNATIETGADYSWVRGTLIERSEILAQEERGAFRFHISERAFAEAGIEPGTVELTLLLIDEDSDWDDLYGMQNQTVDVQYGVGTPVDNGTGNASTR